MRRKTAASIVLSPKDCASSIRHRPKCSTKWPTKRSRHRTMLFDLYRDKFGDYLPLIRRQDVTGFIYSQAAVADAAARPRRGPQLRGQMEYETARFYRKAAETSRDASIRELADKLADIEDHHETYASNSGANPDQDGARRGRRDRPADVCAAICSARPCGLDGRFGLDPRATVRGRICDAQHLGAHFWSDLRHRSAPAFRWDLRKRCPTTARSPAAATPWMRGTICGCNDDARRTRPHPAVSSFRTLSLATIVAIAVVVVELGAIISYIRYRYMDTPFLRRRSRSVSAARWCSSLAY